MKMNFQAMIDRKRQQGAALIIGLLLLVVITILAVSGMNTATTELALARNDQTYENAFQSAETGLETALAQGNWNTAINVVVTPPPTSSYETVTATGHSASELAAAYRPFILSQRLNRNTAWIPVTSRIATQRQRTHKHST